MWGRKRTISRPGQAVRVDLDFDSDWNEGESSESEDTPEQQSTPGVPVSQPLPPKLKVREPTQREIATMSQLYKDKLSEAEIREKIRRKLEIKAERDQEKLNASVPENSAKHISSDDAPNSPLHHQWNPHFYQHQQAISSDQLFHDGKRDGFRAALKRDIISLADDFFTDEQ